MVPQTTGARVSPVSERPTDSRRMQGFKAVRLVCRIGVIHSPIATQSARALSAGPYAHKYTAPTELASNTGLMSSTAVRPADRNSANVHRCRHDPSSCLPESLGRPYAD